MPSGVGPDGQPTALPETQLASGAANLDLLAKASRRDRARAPRPRAPRTSPRPPARPRARTPRRPRGPAPQLSNDKRVREDSGEAAQLSRPDFERRKGADVPNGSLVPNRQAAPAQA